MTETATTQTQSWDPERYARNARFVADLGAPLVELLAPRAGEHILDLGCGDGALSVELMAAGAIVVGVDSGADMIAAARALGVDARIGDGQALTFDAAFDAVFSNAALHWMRDADAVIAGVKRALKPGGRFIAEFGGAGNVAKVRGALVAALERRGIDGQARSPWYFPTPEAYREKLEARGFTVASIALIPRPTPLPGDIRDWLETFCESFLNGVPAAERAALKDEVAVALEATNRDADGGWSVDYVRLRFAAHI
jgi:SAM-dependent methyltransferase